MTHRQVRSWAHLSTLTHSLFDGIPLIHPSLVWSISNPIETSNWIDWIWKCASLRALQASIQICPLASHRVWRACDSCPGYAHSWSDLFGSVVCYYPTNTNTHTHSLSALGNHHQVAALTGCCAWWPAADVVVVVAVFSPSFDIQTHIGPRDSGACHYSHRLSYDLCLLSSFVLTVSASSSWHYTVCYDSVVQTTVLHPSISIITTTISTASLTSIEITTHCPVLPPIWRFEHLPLGTYASWIIGTFSICVTALLSTFPSSSRCLLCNASLTKQ